MFYVVTSQKVNIKCRFPYFDNDVVDASTVIHPLLHANKFILVGDPAQLPPVVQNPAARRLGRSNVVFSKFPSFDLPLTTCAPIYLKL
jgi:hypothetical protein